MMTMGEVCKKYALTADTLRYYEKIGLLPQIGRAAGRRQYTDSDCVWIEFVKCMRGAGVGVEPLVQYIRLFARGEATLEARKRILVGERRRIAAKVEEMRRLIERLDFKIEQYENTIVPAEKRLRPSARQSVQERKT